MPRKALICFSGGMDSATMLARAIHKGLEVVPVTFAYGSKHNEHENKAAHDFADYYGVGKDRLHIDVSSCFSLSKSALLKTGGPIPEGHYEDATMCQTVVPGRNSVFISVLTGLAESMKFDEVHVGIHSGDHAIYPDCRPEYFVQMRAAMLMASDGQVELIAPFLTGNKETILSEGLEIKVPYHLTRTCYKEQPKACGKCGSCVERLEAFAAVGHTDPAPYA
jgi:7-cyano-7-deazaguanine synthase